MFFTDNKPEVSGSHQTKEMHVSMPLHPSSLEIPKQDHESWNRSASHKRINDIFLGKIERKLLNWLCIRLPQWVTPDLLTLTALIAGIIIAAGYALTNFSKAWVWISSFGLMLHWFGDSLDGSLARHRRIERPLYGYFIDHSLDTFVEVLTAIGIGLSPYVRLDCTLLGLAAYLMMSVSVNIRAFVAGIFQISYGKFGPTELRLVLIIANTVFYFIDIPIIGYWHGPVRAPDIVAAGVTAFLTAAFIITTAQTALKLRRIDDSSRKQSGAMANHDRPA